MRSTMSFIIFSLLAMGCTDSKEEGPNGGPGGSAQSKVTAECRDAQATCDQRINPLVKKARAQLETCIDDVTAACKDGIDDDCLSVHADCTADIGALQAEATSADQVCTADITAACLNNGKDLEFQITRECQRSIETCAEETERVVSQGFADCFVPAAEACVNSNNPDDCVQAEVDCLRSAAKLLTDATNLLTQCRTDFIATCL